MTSAEIYGGRGRERLVRGTTNAVPDAGRLVDVLQKRAAQRVDEAVDAHSIPVGAAWHSLPRRCGGLWLSLIQQARLRSDALLQCCPQVASLSATRSFSANDSGAG